MLSSNYLYFLYNINDNEIVEHRTGLYYGCFHLAAANASALLVLPAASNVSIAAPYRSSFA